MTIKTKFNIGDALFFLDKDKIKSSTVEKIKILILKDSIEVGYLFKSKVMDSSFILASMEQYSYIDGDKVFKSKDELIESL